MKRAAVAGLPRAAASVPDGMAAAALVGVNPIHGLYASVAGPIVGGLTASTRLMVVTTTSAAALAALSALDGVPAEDRLGSLFLLTLMAGAIMIAAGFFGLGRFTAFVSHSVMMGFLTGVAVSILLGQIPGLVGAPTTASTSVGRALEVLMHPGTIHVPSAMVGATALLLLFALPQTPLKAYSALVALIVPSAIVAMVESFFDVLQVADTGEIIRGVPVPVIPPLGEFSLSLLAGAFSVAAIVLVQGAGVAQSYSNPDKTRTNQDSDFMAQGWANLASGLFRGIPVGGSVSQTALNVSVGAKDRWASVLSGVWMLVVLVALSGLAGQVAVPTLAAILVVAAIGAIKPREISAVWSSGAPSQIAMVTTFVATLFLPVAAAVGIGVALSLLLSVNREAQDVRVVSLADGEGGVVEGDVPPMLESHSITVLQIYGSLFYAGARTFEAALPVVGNAENPAVIIRLRGRTVVGATAFSILSSYASELEEQGGRLYLSGVDHALLKQFDESGRIAASSPIRMFEATPQLGQSTRAALSDAEAFLISEAPDPEDALSPGRSWFSVVIGWFTRALRRLLRSESSD